MKNRPAYRLLAYGSLTIVAVISVIVVQTLRHLPETPAPERGSVHCVGANATFQCSMLRFDRLTRELGPRVAIGSLKSEYRRNAEVVTDCHQLAHVIGNASAELHGGDIAAAFKEGDSFCWSGYYHGVVERATADRGEAALEGDMNAHCAKVVGKERYSFDYFNCVHGLGHGVMAVKEDDLFSSLPVCDRLLGDWERKSCYGGVFMENVMVDNRTHDSKFLKKDDLMYPCTAVETPYKEQCYLMQTSYALSQNGYDWSATFRLCANVDADFRDTCAQSIGRDASGSSVSDVARTVSYCSLGEDDGQTENCIVGAVKDFISYFHDDTKAKELCAAFPQRFFSRCDATRAEYVRNL
jgi:hypothetical protein